MRRLDAAHFALVASKAYRYTGHARCSTARASAANCGRIYTEGARRMKVSFDEWNAWPSCHSEPHLPAYTLEDALVVGMFLNSFIRNADLVKLANMAQLVNVLPPIVTRPDGVFLQTIYHPLALIANHNGPVALDAWADSETFHTDRYGGVPYLDASASYDPGTRSATVNLTNRDRKRACPVSIEVGPGSLGGPGRLHVVTGEDPKAVNSFAEPDNVAATTRTVEASGRALTLELAPCSVNVLELRLAL